MNTQLLQYCGACGSNVFGSVCESCGLSVADSHRFPPAVLGDEFTYGTKKKTHASSKQKHDDDEKGEKKSKNEKEEKEPKVGGPAVKGIFQKKKVGQTVYEVIYEVNSGLELQDDKPRSLKASDELILWMKRTQDDPPNLAALEGVVVWWNSLSTIGQMMVTSVFVSTLNILIRNSPTSFFLYLLIIQHVLIFLGAFIGRRLFRKIDQFYLKFKEEHGVAAAALQRFVFPIVQKKIEILQLKLWYKRVKFSAIIGGALSTAVIAWFIPRVVLQYLGAVVGIIALFVGSLFAVEFTQVYAPYADYFHSVVPVTN